MASVYGTDHFPEPATLEKNPMAMVSLDYRTLSALVNGLADLHRAAAEPPGTRLDGYVIGTDTERMHQKAYAAIHNCLLSLEQSAR